MPINDNRCVPTSSTLFYSTNPSLKSATPKLGFPFHLVAIIFITSTPFMIHISYTLFLTNYKSCIALIFQIINRFYYIRQNTTSINIIITILLYTVYEIKKLIGTESPDFWVYDYYFGATSRALSIRNGQRQ